MNKRQRKKLQKKLSVLIASEIRTDLARYAKAPRLTAITARFIVIPGRIDIDD
jgi:hypothetical protein